MQRKIKGTVVVFLSAILCCTSCIDNDYDLNKDIDMSVSLGGNAFVIPIGSSEETRLDQIIDESETLKLDDEGRYSIKKEDDIDDVNIDVDAVTIDIDDPDVEPITVDFGDNTKINPFEVATDPSNISVNIDDVTVNPSMPNINGLEDTQTVPGVPNGVIDTDVTLSNSVNIEVNVPESSFENVKTIKDVYFGGNDGQLVTFTIDATDISNNLNPGNIQTVKSINITFPEGFVVSGGSASGTNQYIVTNDQMLESKKRYEFYILKLQKDFDVNNRHFSGEVKFTMDYTINGTFKSTSSNASISAGVPNIMFAFDKANVVTKDIDAEFDRGDIGVSSDIDGLDDVKSVKEVSFEPNTELTVKISRMKELPLNFTSGSKVLVKIPDVFVLTSKQMNGNSSYDAEKHILSIPAQSLIGTGELDIRLGFSKIDFTVRDPNGQAVSDNGILSLNEKAEYYPLSENNQEKLVLESDELETDQLVDLSRQIHINVLCGTSGTNTLQVTNSKVVTKVVSSEFDTSSDLKVHEDNIDKALKSLKQVYWKNNESVLLTMKLNFKDLPKDIKKGIRFSPVKVNLPKFIVFEPQNDIVDNVLTINESFIPQESNDYTYVKTLKIKGMDFTKIDEYKNGLAVTDNHVLEIPEKYTKVEITGEVKTEEGEEINSEQLENFEVKPQVSIEKMVIGKVVGKVDPEIDPVNEEVDLDLGDDLDFLTEDGNEMVLENPVITVKLVNPVGVPVDLDLSMSGYLDGKTEPIEGSTITANTASYPGFVINPALEDGTAVTTYILISRKAVQVNENNSTTKYYNLVLPDLANLMKRVPDQIKFKMNANIDQNVDHYVDITPTISENGQDKARFSIKGHYDVSVPLTFETLNINYTDTIDNLQDDLEDFLDVALSTHVELNGDFVNGIPIDLNINVEPTDANNNPLTNISTKVYVNDQENGVLAGMAVDGQPSITPIKIVLNSQDREELKKLDKLFLNINASASQTNSGITLKGAQTIQLKNMRLYVKKVNLDLN